MASGHYTLNSANDCDIYFILGEFGVVYKAEYAPNTDDYEIITVAIKTLKGMGSQSIMPLV